MQSIGHFYLRKYTTQSHKQNDFLYDVITVIYDVSFTPVTGQVKEVGWGQGLVNQV